MAAGLVALTLASSSAIAAPTPQEQRRIEPPRGYVHAPWMMRHSRSFWGMHHAPWMANRFASTNANDHMDGWGAGTWILMGAGMVVLWGLALLGVVFLVQRRHGPREQGV